MKKYLLLIAVFLLLVVGMGPIARGTIAVFKEGAALTSGGALDSVFASVTTDDVVQVTVDDTGMHANSESTYNYGNSVTSPGSYIALLYKFDLSSLAGATIEKAQLRLYASNGNGTQNLARVTSHPWTEALATRRSWNGQSSPNWGPSSNAVFGGNDIGTGSVVDSLPTGAAFSVEDVTADVQAFVGGTQSNYGWALYAATITSLGNRTYLMSENTNDGVRPALFISYTLSDGTAPAAVTNLATGSATASSITLTWTAPGDDGSTGTATSYDIRYSTAAITEGNWASAAQVSGEPTPSVAGTGESMTVTGLSSETTYYFAIKTSDEVPNTSAISNSPSGMTSDGTAPAAVTNLAAGSATASSITLTWTAPGDDGSSGTASSYDIRYSTSAINEGNWAAATQVSGEPTPAVAGTSQNMAVTGLTSETTYYFAIKASDEVPNTSGISNNPSGTTTGGSGNNKPILGESDFVYQGYYIVHSNGSYDNLAELWYGEAFTHRYVNGELRFLTLSFFGNVPGGGKHLIEFAPPAGGLGGTITTRTNHWPDIMGSAGLEVGSMRWMGLWFEQAQNRLWTTWAMDYPTTQTEAQYTKSLVVRTLNEDGTVSNVAGPWGLEGIQQRRIYGGVAPVPAWFQSTYGVGPYCVGWGGYSSLVSVGPVSLGPTCYAIPEPTNYAAGDIPSSAFKTLMDHSAATTVADWYSGGTPTSFDRGVRNADVTNDYGSYWQSPAPDGLGRWVWGDSNWHTGCWIETPNKQGFITVPKLQNGRAWYQSSDLHCERQSAEIQVFDPNMLGEVAQGTRAVWNTYPTNRWEITSTLTPLGFNSGRNGFGPTRGPCGATYDSTTQTLYIYCVNGTNSDSYILVYQVD